MLAITGKTHQLAMAAVFAFALTAASVMPGVAEAGQAGFVEKTTGKAYDKVVTAIKKAITSNKLVIVKQVPYTKMLKKAGVEADKTVGFEIFHPRYGKVIHANDKSAIVEAPMRILVRQTGGKVMVHYRKPSARLAGYSGLSALGKELDQIFLKIADTATK